MKKTLTHLGLAAALMLPISAQAMDWGQLSGSSTTTSSQAPIFVQNSAEMAVEMDQLREQVRNLNGRVEELSFQLLQFQEQIRKMQEDNEYRFQELEEKKEGKLDIEPKKQLSNLDGENLPGKLQPSKREASRLDGKTEEAKENSANTSEEKVADNAAPTVKPKTPKVLNDIGSLAFDENGNLVEGSFKKPLNHEERGDLGDYSERLDKIIEMDSPAALYKFGRDQIEFGDYPLASQSFNAFLAKYPDHKIADEALYWLGQSYILQEEFQKAAEAFLKHHREYIASDLAADNLLGLGISMAGLNQRELACATFAEVTKQFPTAPPPLMRKLKREKKGASCS